MKPIAKIELQPIDFLGSDSQLLNEISNLNAWLTLRLDQKLAFQEGRIVKVDKPFHLPWHLLKTIFVGRLTRQATKITLLDGYFAARVKPAIWETLPCILQSTNDHQSFQIHLHIRLTNFVGDGDRLIDVYFFQSLLRSLTAIINENGKPHKVVIHTDFLGITIDKHLLVSHAVPQSLKYWQELGILDRNNDLQPNLLVDAKNKLDAIIEEIPHCEFYETRHWTDEWESMAVADILIMGKSSYSAVGGLLNNRGLVIGPEYWHSKRDNWFTSDNPEVLASWVASRL